MNWKRYFAVLPWWLFFSMWFGVFEGEGPRVLAIRIVFNALAAAAVVRLTEPVRK